MISAVYLVLTLPVSRAAESDQGFRSQQTAAVGEYQLLLAQAMERYKRYPSTRWKKDIRGWHLCGLIDRDGRIASVSVTRSSGYALLDDAASMAARKAKVAVPIPAQLRGYSFEARVRVAFVLPPVKPSSAKTRAGFPGIALSFAGYRRAAAYAQTLSSNRSMKDSHKAICSRSQYSLGLCACSIEPGPQMIEGMPACSNNPASVA